jgi:hypothetical protein
MTPQSNFMVLAPILAEREHDLRTLLETMTAAPGMAEPENALFPFARFPRLHVARFVILNDATLDDLPPGDPLRQAPVCLAFLGDCDGDPATQLAEFAAIAGDGLRRIFRCCAGFAADAELLRWMHANSVVPATQYVNWVGRTVRQIHEEQALHDALQSFVQGELASLAGLPPRAVRDRLIEFHMRHGPALTPSAPTPVGWWFGNLANLILFPLVLLLLFPFLLIGAPFFIMTLRRLEKTDSVIAPRPDTARVAALSHIEDHDVTNQFSAFGNVKPGLFRLWTLLFIFRLLDFTTRHIYTRGRLARVGTIHFARWVFTDNRRRLFFASNYDGSLDSYMDDFINKVAYGLNLVFSNGIGYPRTSFLVNGGAKREMEFKYYLRRHEVPTQVWYKAYPGLTAADLARNTMIREGLERPHMTDAQARAWLALI